MLQAQEERSLGKWQMMQWQKQLGIVSRAPYKVADHKDLGEWEAETNVLTEFRGA